MLRTYTCQIVIHEEVVIINPMVFLIANRNIRAAKIIVGISRPSVAGYNTDEQLIPFDVSYIDVIEFCNSLLKQISVIHNMNF